MKKYMETSEFVKMIEKFIERYKHDIKENKSDFPIKEWKDEHFKMWHIIKDAYEEGFNQANNYYIEKLFELTNAEEVFRDKIRNEI